MATTSDILAQLEAAGLADYIAELDPCAGDSISGRMRIGVVNVLDADARFASGPLYQLHRDVGKQPAEWRAFRGELGTGSLQIVIDKQTGRFHADVDRFNPYADVVGFAGHSFLEVVPYLFKKLFRRRRKPIAISTAKPPADGTTDG